MASIWALMNLIVPARLFPNDHFRLRMCRTHVQNACISISISRQNAKFFIRPIRLLHAHVLTVLAFRTHVIDRFSLTVLAHDVAKRL